MGLFSCDNKKEKTTVDKSANKLTTEQLFPENSIGIAYLDTIIGDEYHMTIRFPNSSLTDSIPNRDTSNYTKDIIIDLPAQTLLLFDQRGQLIKLNNVTNCISRFWCENDGGIQYEPSYELTLDKKDFAITPKLQDKKRLENIACFAVINYNPYQFKSFYIGKESRNVVMRGRLSNDYSGYSETIQDSVYKYYDRNAQIILEEDDSGMTDFCIMLQVFNSRREFELGCCGP